jgi:hypothetical protein
MKLRKKNDELKKKEAAKVEDGRKFEKLPVVVCDNYIYPGMKTIMTVDTRQLRDMVHVVTSVENSWEARRKFIVVRKYTDMRGFMMTIQNLFNSS